MGGSPIGVSPNGGSPNGVSSIGVWSRSQRWICPQAGGKPVSLLK